MIGAKAGTHEALARYLLAGGVNTAITYALLLVAMRVLNYAIAYSLVYVLGIALGYWLQCRFVFRVPLRWRSAVAFPLVYFIQYLVGLALLFFLVELTALLNEVAALVVVLVNVPLGFVLSRLFLRSESAATRTAAAHNPGRRDASR